MNYKQFLSFIEVEMSLRFDESYTISIQPLLRNNGTTLDGLTIFKPSSNLSPTIYMNPYYHRYLDGVSMQDICDDIYEAYISHVPDTNMDTDFFLNFDKVKNHIVMKLINYERNQALLRDVPFLRYLDLAVVFQIYLSDQAFGNGTVLIHNSHMEAWNTNAKELYSAARKNSPEILGPYCEAITSCIQEMAPGLLFPFHQTDECQMKILTNNEKNYGAAVILYEGVLKNLAEGYGCDLIVLPSSVHEVILLPAEEEMDFDEMSEMIQEINETELKDEEILSDHPYYYSRRNDQLTPVGKGF